MSRAVKVILGILLFGVIACAVCVGVGYRWVQDHKGQLNAEADQADRDAAGFARSHRAAACVEESVRRLKQAHGILSQAMTKVFLSECLKAAAPSPTLCTGVPAPTEFMKSATWSVRMCEARGMPESQPCAQLMQGLEEYCEKHPKPASAQP